MRRDAADQTNLRDQAEPENSCENGPARKSPSPVGKDEFDASRPVPNMPKRPGQPAEAAKAVLFLACDDCSFTYGESLFVDGGVLAMDQS